MLSPSSRALLRQVAAALIESGECVMPRPLRCRVPSRLDVLREIARDPRLHSRARHTQTSLIDEVADTLKVTRSNAKVMIYKARKLDAARRV